MIAALVMCELAARGMRLSVSGAAVRVEPASTLTDEDRQQIRSRKAEILAYLLAGPPRVGTMAKPVIVRGAQLPNTDCLWSTCGGTMTAHGGNRYLCSDCATWFE